MQDPLQRRGHAVSRWILLVVGGLGAIGAAVQFGRGALRGSHRIDNPVFANVQRLPHEQTMLYHASAYGTDLLIILSWLLFLLLTAYVAAVLLHAFYRSAPVAVLVAGALLAGAQIAGLLIATSLQKVVEFVLQSGTAAPAEAAWLAAGVNYLIQLHLFYVSAWIVATGAGWLFLGAAARAAGAPLRGGALLVSAGGVLFLAGAVIRALLPFAGATAPAVLLGTAEAVPSAAFALGLIGYATLLQRVGDVQCAVPADGPRSQLPSLP
jgi:hypothetical protein